MCTAITYKTRDFYFGRTLDYEHGFGEEVVITPRHYPFVFRHMGEVREHYAMIGMACVADGYPLYYDGVNECGLGIAGLNFVGNAYYSEVTAGKDNISPFELIPWLLSCCSSVNEVREKMTRINLCRTPFSEALPLADLHFLIADHNESIVLEAVREGNLVYENPVGVLTNNPPFDKQLFRIHDYLHLSSENPSNTFSDKIVLSPYSRGMGGLGLPGDFSSSSRFIRACFVKLNSVSGDTEEDSVCQFFHILSSVEQPMGCCSVGEGQFEKSIYTSCCNADRGIYYYTTYSNRQISAVDMKKVDLELRDLFRYPLITSEKIYHQN